MQLWGAGNDTEAVATFERHRPQDDRAGHAVDVIQVRDERTRRGVVREGVAAIRRPLLVMELDHEWHAK